MNDNSWFDFVNDPSNLGFLCNVTVVVDGAIDMVLAGLCVPTEHVDLGKGFVCHKGRCEVIADEANSTDYKYRIVRCRIHCIVCFVIVLTGGKLAWSTGECFLLQMSTEMIEAKISSNVKEALLTYVWRGVDALLILRTYEGMSG